MKLSKKSAAAIGSLVNSIMVDVMMQDSAKQQGDSDMLARWLDNEAVNTCKLADDWGIELPTLARKRERVAEIEAARAARRAAVANSMRAFA